MNTPHHHHHQAAFHILRAYEYAQRMVTSGKDQRGGEGMTCGEKGCPGAPLLSLGVYPGRCGEHMRLWADSF